MARRFVLPVLGGEWVNSIAPETLRSFYGDLKRKGVGVATIEVCHRLVSRVLAQAVREGLIAVNPASAAKAPRRRRRDRRVLTEHQVMKLAWVADGREMRMGDGVEARRDLLSDELLQIDALSADELLSFYSVESWWDETPLGYGRLILLSAYAGLRFGEVAGLRESHLQGRHIRVVESVTEVDGVVRFGEPKTAGSRRRVALPTDVADILTRHLEHREEWLGEMCRRRTDGNETISSEVDAANPLLFSTRQGFPLSRTRFRSRVWVPAVDAVGLEPRPTFHELRHTHGAWATAKGDGGKVLQARLGHSSIRTTVDIYGHVADGLDEAAADKFGGGTYVARTEKSSRA